MPGHDFLVVGGGIGGAVLAELLARGGARVLVLERNVAPPTWNRPELLWPATIRQLAALLPVESLLHEAALPTRGVQIAAGGRLYRVVPEELLQRTGIHPWFTNPNVTRELLLRHASFELRRGVEAVELLLERGRVVGARARDVATGRETELTARWTVGDDGVHSRVRDAAGIGAALRTFPLEFDCFRFRWPASLPPRVLRTAVNLAAPGHGLFAALLMPLPDGEGTGVVATRIDAEAGALRRAFDAFRSSDPVLGEIFEHLRFPEDFARIRREWGHADHYGAAGALLLGDAAHPVSPVGGQGANMAVADARALARLALSGIDGDELVGAYERVRRPSNSRSLRFTRIAARLFAHEAPGLPAPAAHQLLAALENRPELVARFLRLASTAFLDDAERGGGRFAATEERGLHA